MQLADKQLTVQRAMAGAKNNPNLQALRAQEVT